MGRNTRAAAAAKMEMEEGEGKEGEELKEEEEHEDDDAEEEEDEDEEDDEDDEDDEEDNEVLLQDSLAFGREKRVTMGKRMGNMVGEELDKDETFWEDSKWKVDDAESEYSNASESGDEVDSDFSVSGDEDEGEDDREQGEEAERAVAAREKRQQQQEANARSKYREPKRKLRPVKDSTFGLAPRPEMSAEEVARMKERRTAARLRREAALMAPVDRAKRATTQEKTVATQEALARKGQEEAKRTTARAPRATKCIFSQEELLREACQTEQENARWLLGRRRLQNETDATSHAPKRQVKLKARFVSRRGGYRVVNFPEVDLMPGILRGEGAGSRVGGEAGRERVRGAPQAEKGGGRRRCVVTGLPARYLDPLTRQPYANRQAFKILRGDPRYLPEGSGEEERGGVSEGGREGDSGSVGVSGGEGEGRLLGLERAWSRSSSITDGSFR